MQQAVAGGAAPSLPNARERLDSCIAAAEAGLPVDEQRRALVGWAEILGEEGAPDGDHIGVLVQFLDSDLAASFKLLDDPLDIERVCRAVDLLGARAVARAPDRQRADALIEALRNALPVAPECSLTAMLLRPDRGTGADIYAVAKAVHASSPDRERIAVAWAALHEDKVVRAHHRARMTPDNRAKLADLERFEKELDQQFGTMICGTKSVAHSAGQALVSLFSKEIQAEREANRESRSRWLSRLSSAAGSRLFGRDEYIDLYARFLEARVDAVHSEIPAAIKLFREVLEGGFDPLSALDWLSHCLHFRRKDEEARSLLEEWIPRFSGVDPPGSTQSCPPGVLSSYEEFGGQISTLRPGV